MLSILLGTVILNCIKLLDADEPCDSVLFLKHLTDCNAYVECRMDRFQLKQCPGSLHDTNKIRKCVFPGTTFCRIDHTNECESTIDHLPHSDCTKYYTCSFGVPKENLCNIGLHWSIKKRKCVPPETSECVQGAIPAQKNHLLINKTKFELSSQSNQTKNINAVRQTDQLTKALKKTTQKPKQTNPPKTTKPSWQTNPPKTTQTQKLTKPPTTNPSKKTTIPITTTKRPKTTQSQKPTKPPNTTQTSKQTKPQKKTTYSKQTKPPTTTNAPKKTTRRITTKRPKTTQSQQTMPPKTTTYPKQTKPPTTTKPPKKTTIPVTTKRPKTTQYQKPTKPPNTTQTSKQTKPPRTTTYPMQTKPPTTINAPNTTKTSTTLRYPTQTTKQPSTSQVPEETIPPATSPVPTEQGPPLIPPPTTPPPITTTTTTSTTNSQTTVEMSTESSSTQPRNDCANVVDTEDVLLPHPVCTKFYQCNFGLPIEMPCSAGLHFHAEMSVCDYPTLAKCIPGAAPEQSAF